MPNAIASSVLGVVGFDTKAAVDGLLAFDKLAITQAQKKQTNQTAKQDAFAVINDAMLAFKSTALSMADSTKFFAYSAALTSNDPAVAAGTLLDVTGTDAVSAGTHKIIVQQVAQAQRLSSGQGVTDSLGSVVSSDQTALSMVGSFNVGAASISVIGTDTLQDIASKINQQNTGATATGVSASIIKVGNNDFRLVLASDQTGATGFTLTGAALDAGGALANLQLGSGVPNARNSIQQGLDAQVSIDGLSIFRSSNTISDALNGVTLTLKQANLAEVSMNISVDTASLRNNVQSFVDAYNKVQGLVNSQFSLDPKTGTTGILASESVLTSIQSTLSSSLLQSIPGLASDRNTMVSVGIEPDAKGVLTINPTLFDKFITTDPTAIRDVFVANGISSNQQVQFLTSGLNTPSGTYQINISQAASKASVSSSATTDLVNATLASPETLTITDSASQRQAIVNLTAGMNQASILTALNTEFSKQTTDIHQLSGSLGAGLTVSNSLTSLGKGIAAGDTITISGTNRQGGTVNGSFSVLDPATDNISTLLSAIQSTFNQQVVASLDTATGKIQVSDVQSGDSLLTVNLTANNQGGGSLNLGTDTVLKEGRYAMSLAAIAQGNGISIQGKSFGSSSNFSINQSVNGLGIVNQNASGQSIIGSINGISARGSGQLLIGNSGKIDGLGVLYTGASTGNIASVTVGVGLGAKMEGLLDLFANPFTGLIQSSISSSQSIFDTLTTRIADMERQMAQKKTSLDKSFLAMQQSLSVLNQAGSFLTQQVNAQNARTN
ncbi:MAG: flagellar filament capping protein FliD [Mariprofundaceae bacterium]|nr:flagellar filament capping protein FliD [Mariprofundaceae bacterium]